MTPAFPAPAWLIGCGNMAGAMVDGWRAAAIDLSPVTVIRPSGTMVAGVRTVTALPAGEAPRFVMLGVKPQKLDHVVADLAPRVGADTILVSLLAGVTAATLRQRFPAARAILRAMPNLPVAPREGVTALYCEDADAAARAQIEALMAALGLAPWCDDEAAFSAIGAVAGSGPAYVARFAAALAQGGEGLGLEPRLAYRVAVQTLVGTAAMATATKEEMGAIARRVASPAGTTEQGLAVLDADDGLQRLVDRMLAAAIARGRDLAAAAAVDSAPPLA
ncbi:MAG: pyrroline-5-carboxylate reductase [Sphingomonas bacterium]|nr:pyrroline-5-carboxylate reductase [Sphingomonas bacterium]